MVRCWSAWPVVTKFLGTKYELKKTKSNYEQEGDSEIYRADNCINRDSDCDGTGSDELRKLVSYETKNNDGRTLIGAAICFFS